MKNSFPAEFELYKQLVADGLIGSIFVWDGKAADGEPIAEGEIDSKKCEKTEQGETITYKTAGEVDWTFANPEDVNEVTAAIGIKNKINGGEVMILSEPVTLKKPENNNPENPDEEPEINPSDNKPMSYSTEKRGDYEISYNHEIPFQGRNKITAESFGENFNVSKGGITYKVKKIKANKKKHYFQLTGLDTKDKPFLIGVKKATKGKDGLPYKQNPYYVKDTDDVVVKIKKRTGKAASVKIMIGGKYYRAKKNEWSHNTATNTIIFKGENLAGSYWIH